MKKNTNKVVTTSLGVMMAVSSTMSSAAPVSVYAETIDTPEKGFAVTDSKTGNPVALGGDTVVKVYTDSTKTEELEGIAKVEGSRVVFAPTSALDSTSEFYFSIKADGYEEAFGGPFTFVEGDLDVSVKKITPENITFKTAGGETLSTADITFKKGGSTITVPYSNGAFDFSAYEAGDVIDYTVNKTGYVIKGDSITLANGNAEVSLELTKKADLEVSTTAIDKTYGDEEFNVSPYVEAPSGYTEGFTYTVKDGSDIVDVDSDGKVTIKKAGAAVITVESKETEDFSATSTDIAVTVNKKDLGAIDASAFDWPTIEKTFDGEVDFSADGTLKSGKGLVGDDTLGLAIEMDADSANVGERTTTITKVTFSGDVDNYTYQFNQNDGPTATIKAKALQVSVNDLSVVYGSDEWKDLKKGNLPDSADLKELVSIGGSLNATDNAAIEKFKYADIFSVVPDAEAYQVGTATDKLTLSTKVSTVGNYSLTVTDNKANINIAAQNMNTAEAWNKVAVDNDNSSYISKSGNTTFVRAGGKVVFKANDADGLYDTVNLKETAPNAASGYSNELVIPETAVSGNVSANFFLSNSNGSDTRIADQEMPEGVIKVDADYPELTFEDGTGKHSTTKTGDTPAVNTLTFDHAVRAEGYTLKVAVEDKMSGVDSTEYAIISVGSESEANDAITAACKTNATNWTKLPESREVKVDGTKSGYYIVLVKTSDKVGNEAVYASNGTVVDVTAPTLTINDINSAKVYGEDVNYSLTIGDPVDANGVHSGIDKVVVNVTNGGKKTAGSNGVDSYELTAEDIYGNGAGDKNFAAFDKSSKETTVNGVITASKNDSNNVKIEVTVYDKSGNYYTASKTLMIDIDDPTLAASYDNNDVRNGKYFNSDRKMTVAVTERNFDESNLKIKATVDGQAGEYSIKQIRDGEVDGIYLATDRADSEKGGNTSTYTNNRKNTYVIGFGGNGTLVDHDYKVDVTYEDAAGNSTPVNFGSSKAATEFTIDEIAPVITMAYTNGKGTSTLAGENKDNPYYDTKSVGVKVNVEERNFTNANVGLAVTSKDSSDKNVNAYAQSDVDAAKTANWTDEGSNKHSYEMKDFTKDANYSVAGTYMDLAGNQATAYAAHYFTVDTTAPTGKLYVTGSDGVKKEYSREESKDGGVLEFIFNLFDKNSIKIENDAADATSGLKSVKYCLVDVDADAADTFTINTDFEKLDWQDWSSELKVNSDKTAVVFARLEDKAGHLTYVSSDGGLIVDKKEAETPTISVEGGGKDYYNDDFTVDVSANDPDNGGRGVFSGMKEIRYQLIDDNTGRKSEVKSVVTSSTPREKSLAGKINIDASEWNTNNLRVHIIAEDFAGNTVEKDVTYTVDATAPVVTTSMDTSDVKNGKYYNTTKIITADFNERNFDATKASMKVTVDGVEKTYTMKQIVDGEAAKDGIIISSVSDTQENTKKASLTDDRKVTYKVAVGNETNADHTYTNVSFACTDLAGNKGSASLGKEIVVDKIAPVLRFSYSDGNDITDYVTTNANSPYFGNKNIVATISVDEKHFAESGINLKLSQKNNAGKDVDAYDGSLSPTGWTTKGDNHTVVMKTFSGDAIYGLAGEFTDLAGNKAQVYDAHYFCVDKTAPEGSITINAQTGAITSTTLHENEQFGVIENGAVEVSRDAYDVTSGIASIKYYRYVPDPEARGTFKVLTKEQLSALNWTDWSGNLSVAPDSQAVLYAKITDRAGNITYINSNGGIISDRTNPAAPKISIDAKASKGVFNSNVPVSFSAEDVLNGGTYAGLKNVKVQVLKDGVVTQEQSYDYSPKEDRKRSMNSSITVDAQKNNSNNVVIRVTAVDYAGNQSSSEQKIAIDITAPRIEVVYDNNNPANGKYYNNVRTATVKVYERNFDPDGIAMNITGSGGAKPTISGWTIGKDAGVSDDNVNTCTITYSADADYTFTMAATDLAGNKTNYGKTDEFVIDRTKPVISVSYDNNNGKGKYYNAARTATITVKEHNFDAKGFTAALKAYLSGNGIATPAVSGWSSNGDTHTATITFSKDGDYSFILDFVDLAGNKADTFTQEEFTIDLTNPEITFSGVEDKSANRGDVIPSITFSDTNFDKNSIVITLEGLKHAKKTVTGSYASSANGGTVTLADFEHVASEDDIYTLTATMTDAAGNVTTKSITFSVNRFGSNYYFSKDSEEYLNSRYHKKGQDITIYEVNVDELKENGVTVVHDGTAVKLTKDQYTVRDITSQNDWKTYEYVIDADCFKDEGLYEIVTDSVDAAGNRQDNKLKESPIEFVIDQTPPSVVITGAENNAVYDQLSRKMTFKVSDDQALGDLVIYVDDKEVARYDAKQLNEMDGKVEYELEEAGKWQTVTAKVTDAAGNEGKEDSVRVLVTTNSLLRMLNNIAVRTGAGILGVSAIGALIFFLAKKKKKKDEDETPGDGNDHSDDLANDGNDHSDDLAEPGNTADTTDGTGRTEETEK